MGWQDWLNMGLDLWDTVEERNRDLEFRNVPMSPDAKAVYDRAMGFSSPTGSPTRNLLNPAIGSILQQYGGLSWNSPATISGAGLPASMAGMTGYGGSAPSTFDWAALAARMGQPGAGAPPAGPAGGATGGPVLPNGNPNLAGSGPRTTGGGGAGLSPDARNADFGDMASLGSISDPSTWGRPGGAFGGYGQAGPVNPGYRDPDMEAQPLPPGMSYADASGLWERAKPIIGQVGLVAAAAALGVPPAMLQRVWSWGQQQFGPTPGGAVPGSIAGGAGTWGIP